MKIFLRNHFISISSGFALLLFSTLCFSQTASDLFGDWKIVKVELSPDAEPEEKQMLPILKSIFLKSTFHFKPDNSFSFNSPDDDLTIKDGIWQFDVKKRYIKVVERKSKDIQGILMGITVNQVNGTFLFLMEESPLILTVVKKT